MPKLQYRGFAASIIVTMLPQPTHHSTLHINASANQLHHDQLSSYLRKHHRAPWPTSDEDEIKVVVANICLH